MFYDKFIRFVFIFAVVACLFSLGRLYQVKRDKKYLDESIESYNRLYEEYEDYKKHSYILVGKD